MIELNSFTDDNPSCLCGEDKSLLVVFKDLACQAYDLATGLAVKDFQCLELSDETVFEFPSIAAGESTEDQTYLFITRKCNVDFIIKDGRFQTQ